MKFGILKTLYYLFFFPAVFLDLKKMPWWRGFCSLLLSTFLLSLLFFAFQAPSFGKEFDTFFDWLGSQITGISVNNQDQVVISSEKEIPFESSHDSFLLLVEKANSPVDESRMNTPSGLWLSPTDVVHWTEMNGEKFFYKPVEKGKLANDSLFGDLIKIAGGKNEMITSDDFKKGKGTVLFVICLGFFFFRALTMLFYILAIVAINKLLKSPITDGRTFMQTVGIYCFASIPAMCFATIYSSLPMDFNFSSAYLLALLFYIFFISGRYLLPEDFLIKQTRSED